MRFHYSPGGLPFVTVALTHQHQTISRTALVDSGSTINVLPYEDGLDLGFSVAEQSVPLKDEGLLQGTPVYGVLLTMQIASFAPVELAFAWTRKSRQQMRLILGQTNFFESFEITFRGREKAFDISPYD
jgi:hypothetical protein